VEDSLEELAQLAATAGVEVVGAMVQRLTRPTPAYYLGKGKVKELAELKAKVGYDVILFDDELSPTQQRNLEQALQVKIIDRSALILDIFAKRAQTHEGRLQVELAQHQYLLPRLAGQWSHLERLGGGIGTRGPGESQIETDRRLVQQKIHRLKKEIEQVRKHRTLRRRHRSAQGIPILAIIGYTNAGKSTLLNALTSSTVLVEEKLFATLDPITRRLTLANGQQALMSDTVGFIQKLPPTVVAAFRATLEELTEADLLLHVIDITHENALEQSITVERILGELGLGEKPRLTVLNKADLMLATEEEFNDFATMIKQSGQDAVLISAAKGWGLNALLARISEKLSAPMEDISIALPYGATDLVRLLRRYGTADTEEYHASGILIRGRIPPRLLTRFQEAEGR